MTKPFDFKPSDPTTQPKTLLDLKLWMEANGCNFLSYQVGSSSIAEGFVLEKEGNFFVWKFTERGVENVIKAFESESDAVAHAFEEIKTDVWAWSHCIGFLSSKTGLATLQTILQNRKVSYYDDVIPYGGEHNPRYRVYVHGSDAVAVADLRERFYSAL